jgi:hypothetical protein
MVGRLGDKGKEQWLLLSWRFDLDGYKIETTHCGGQKSAEVCFQEYLTNCPSVALNPVFVAKLQLASLERKVTNVEIKGFKIGDKVF